MTTSPTQSPSSMTDPQNITELRYYVNNPSAWCHFDRELSDKIEKFVVAYLANEEKLRVAVEALRREKESLCGGEDCDCCSASKEVSEKALDKISSLLPPQK